MACTAVSIDPCPVMSAISVRGKSFFTFSRNSRPDMCGITMSLSTMWTDCSSRSASADSPLSASRQTNPSASPTVTHSLRILCSSSTTSRRIRKSSLPPALFIGLPKSLRNYIDKLLHPKGFLHARGAGLVQGGDRLLVGNIAGNKDDSRSQIGTISRHPGVYLASIHPTGRAHVGYHAQERAIFQQSQRIHARLAADYGISATFESRLHIGHDGGLVFDP